MELICCSDVSLSYEKKTVVEGLSFSVGEGDYLCVAGENGSGKSTLIKALLSLKPVTKGRMTFRNLRKTQIGYLPQQFDLRRDFPASVWEVVLSGCANRLGFTPFYRTLHRRRAFENMEKLGIGTLRKQFFSELSGGQQQRVLLARALCSAEKLLLLDEPAAGLDPVAAEELYRLIGELNREGMTVIMVSHDLRRAVREVSHVLHLGSRQNFFGTAEAYRESAAGRRFLGEGGDPCD